MRERFDLVPTAGVSLSFPLPPAAAPVVSVIAPVVPLLVPEGDPARLGVRLDRQQRILVGRERRWVLIVVASRIVPVAEVGVLHKSILWQK